MRNSRKKILKMNSRTCFQSYDPLIDHFGVAFKFGRHVHFALKMLKSPIARLPAILLDLINCPSGETDCIHEQMSSEIRRGPN